MTVKELISELNKYNPNTIVCIDNIFNVRQLTKVEEKVKASFPQKIMFLEEDNKINNIDTIEDVIIDTSDNTIKENELFRTVIILLH